MLPLLVGFAGMALLFAVFIGAMAVIGAVWQAFTGFVGWLLDRVDKA